MNPSELPDETLFDGALNCRTPEERAAYLDRMCQGKSELRRQLEALLEAHEKSGPFLEPLADARQTVRLELPREEEASGTTIGRYKLLQKIGEGGMGDVYMAEQTEPVRRKVAFKIIKLGMDTKQVVARFEAERQALALMDHPNIAKVLDAGSTDTGRPYFVMELVHGVPITEYCDKNRLSTDDRLNLFIQVCHAIQHAHQKGIIHRDIKPSNVMVTLHDGMPVPKVIDFGVAKATNQRLTEKTLFTNYAQMIGTPAYMSPEQAEMSGLDIDTRSDVYSLGVLLYELLTGTTPFDAKELLSKGYAEMQRIIAQQEPLKPSTRMSTLQQEQRTVISQNRGVAVSDLSRALRGDLDWIVMKCLEKDRTRRYEAATGLAMDLQRHLNTEPVLARPPSKLYEFQKSVRRHKFGFAAAGGITLALAVGLFFAMSALRREQLARVRAVSAEQNQSRLRQEADQARAQELELRQQAEANEQRAETEAARSAQVAQFMKDMLSGVGPSVALGRDTTLLREILDQTAGRLENLKDQPQVQADLLQVLAVVYRDLNDTPRAEALLREALNISTNTPGVSEIESATLFLDLGQVLHWAGRYQEAEAIYRRVLKTQEQALGHENLAVATTLNCLGSVLRVQASNAEAEESLREALRLQQKLLSKDDPELAATMRNLGMVLTVVGKNDEAAELQRQGLDILRVRLPLDHPMGAAALAQLASTQVRQGKIAEAETNYLKALAIQRKVLGDHRDTINTLLQLGDLLASQNRFPDAENRLREALRRQQKTTGSTATVLARLSDVLQRQGKQAEVDKLLGEQMAAWDGKSEENRPLLKMADTRIAIGKALFAAGKPDEAEAAYRQALKIRQSYLGTNEGARVLESLGDNLWKAKQGERAEIAYREALQLHIKLEGPEDPNTAEALNRLAQQLLFNDKPAEAEAFARAARNVVKKLEINANVVPRAHYLLGNALYHQNKLAEAEVSLREAITYASISPTQAGYARRYLADILMRQERFAEAKKLLMEAAQSSNPSLLNGLAWDLAIAPQPAMRDDSSAVAIAERAVALTGRTNEMFVDTLAAAYANVGDFTNAVRIQQEAIALLPKEQTDRITDYNERLRLYQAGVPYRENVSALAADARRWLEAGNYDRAEVAARECLEVRRVMIPDSWSRFNAEAMLGGALLGQGKVTEAEPLLLSGYRGMKERESTIPDVGKPRLKEAAERLAKLYQIKEQPEKAAEWQKTVQLELQALASASK